ncbi:MAG: Ig-like domain-containing protein [Candidatus Thiodiazotropha lotti]|nr:Ig-like domain-containing protein [Candidatus Thiodiazotropha lotti]MCG8003104.1 Ig-like domain-containing protein [Candidatus Thiodiazotropha lotti]MCW4186725.1 Ig-like domain-containing protein [Candidatus Thiodiazotropha lotti]MCW4198319.1 Ig-like domain-containing protein [Candidatus Thiodiazotropha lotti]
MKRRRSNTQTNTLVCEELEPRLLLSADLAGAAIDLIGNDTEQPANEADLQTIEAALQSENQFRSDPPEPTPRELVIIDPATPDYESMLDDLLSRNDDARQFEIVLLTSGVDGIDQISEILAEYDGLDAIHVISHGSEGEIRLGDTNLDLELLQQSVEQITTWGEALTAEGDWLIYGCDIASTSSGEQFIEQFAALTGADIAASDDATGQTRTGGDWQLEYRVGSIETGIAFTRPLQENWGGTLDIVTGLVGHYSFDEGGGGTALDSSVSGNHGTLVGGPAYTTGQVGSNALNFNGDFDRVEIPDNAATNFGIGDFTVAFWFNSTQSGTTARLAGDMDGGDGYVFYTTGGGDITFQVTSGIDSVALTTGGLFDGNWHHVVGTVSGSDWLLYVDNILADAINNPFVGNIDNVNTLRIGASSASHNEYDGLIDEVRLYDRTFTSGDVTELFLDANDAPVLNSASLSISEGETVTLSGTNFSVTDPEENSFTYTVSSLSGGYFQLSSNPGVSITSFTTANLNGSLVQFVDDDNEVAPSFSVSANDGFNDSNTLAASVTYTPVNDDPNITNLDGDICNYTEGDGVILLEQGGDIAVSDPDSGNFAGGSLTVEVDSGLQAAEDVFSIFNQGTAGGEIGFNGSDVTYSGTVIGSVTGGTGIDPLTVSLNSNSSLAAISALIRNFTYENSNGDNPTGGSRSITIDLSDGDGGASVTQNLTLNVSSVNDAPVVDLNGSDGAGVDFAVTFTEDAGAVNLVDTDATISDAETTLYENLSINLSSFVDGSSEQIVIAGYTFSYGTADIVTRSVGGTSFVIDFDGSGFNVTLDGLGWMPETDLQTLLRGVTYENTSQDPTAGDRTVNIFAQDSDLLSGPTVTSTITVNPQNDTPTATDNTNSVSESGFVSGNVITDDSGSGVDSDPEGDSLQVTLVAGGAYTPGLPVTLASGAQVTFQANGTYSYNTNGQFEGLGAGGNVDDSFTYQISDGNGGSATATVTITVNGSNDIPSITNAALSVSEGETVTLGDANFAISDADSVAFSYNLSGITGGYFQLSTNAGVSITNFSSTELSGGLVQFVDDGNEIAPTFSVTVNDGLADSNTLAALISYTQTNDAPVNTVPGSASTSEDVVFSFTGGNQIQINDSDHNGATLQVQLNIGSGGLLNLGDTTGLVFSAGDGANDANMVFTGTLADINAALLTLTFTPDADFSGDVNFTITTNDQGNSGNDPGLTGDAGSEQDSDSLTITVNPVNDNPVAHDDSISLNEGGTTSTLVGGSPTVLNNDTELGDTPVTVSLVTDVNYGTLTLNSDGTFSYTHNGSENFTDNFTYRLTDNDGQTSDATVNITITPVSDSLPVANDDSLSLAQGGTATTLTGGSATVLNNDTGLSDTPATVSLVTDVTNGTLILNGDGTFSYTHDGSSNLLDAFTYRVTDNDGQTSDASVSISVTPAVDAIPTANADTISLAEGGTATTLVGGSATVLNNDTGLDDTPVTISLVTDVSYGALSLNSDGTFTYTHNGSENFTDSFTYRLTDNDGQTSDATVNITITPVSDSLPVANDDSLSLAQGGTATTLTGGSATVLNNDTGLSDTPATVSLVTDVTNGTLILNGDGTFSYTHDGSSNLLDAFTYRVTDNDGQTSDASVSISVTPAVDAIPTANADTISLAEGGTATTLVGGSATVLNNDTGLDDTPVTVSLVTDVNYGTLMLNSDGTFSYTHDGSNNLTDSFVYRVTDSGGDASETTVVINVISNNSAPVASDLAITVLENGIYSGNLPPALDDDGNRVIYQLETIPTQGSVTVEDDGRFNYSPDADYHGPDSFVFTVRDASGNENSYLVEISVISVNDAPVISSHGASEHAVLSVEENSTFVTQITADDPDNDTLSFAIESGADLGFFMIDPLSGELRFSDAPDVENPVDADQDNLYQIRVLVSDGNGGTDSQLLTIEVTDVDEFDVGLLMDIEQTPDIINPTDSLSAGVGITAWAEDPDASSNRITYSLDDNSNGLFTINPSTGVVTLVSAVEDLDTTQYEITVRATSTDGSYSLKSFSITLHSLIEPPPESEEPYLDDIIYDLAPSETTPSDQSPPDHSMEPTEPLPASTVEDALSDSTQDVALPDKLILVADPQPSVSDTDRQTIDRFDRSLFNSEGRNSNSDGSMRIQATATSAAELPQINTLNNDLVEVPDTIWELLDAMNQEMSDHRTEQTSNDGIVLKSATFGTLTLSAGYVAWLLRAGVLSASLLSFSPLWRQIDPLPVLSANAKRNSERPEHSAEEDPQDKRVAKLFDRKKTPKSGQAPQSRMDV